MKARTITSAARMDNNSRSGHTGASAAPASNTIKAAKVEATCHQLVFTDSTVNGMVAFRSSLPDRAPDGASGQPSYDFGTFSNIFTSQLGYVGGSA
jgi:hypothetical protein